MQMPGRNSNAALAAGLLFAVFLWGANNTGTKILVKTWPPIATGGSRFVCAGLLLAGILRYTSWLGNPHPLNRDLSRQLWLRGGLSLAVYIMAFNWAVRLTSASHVALYLAASPVWALLWEERPALNRRGLRRYGGAILALAGVFVLFWPALRNSTSDWRGESLGLAASLLWTIYGRQCRKLGAKLSGAETSAHTMWRAGCILLAVAVCAELPGARIVWRTDLALIQLYCIVAGGVVAFALWNQALGRWPTSRVLLFNNLIPPSTMAWSHFWLHETVTATFWTAMLLVIAGVVTGQADWRRVSAQREPPPE
jgi:drug/metabolite transporter (DMT)-like permease